MVGTAVKSVISPEARRDQAAAASNLGEHFANGAGLEGRAQHVDDAVNVMQRQDEQRTIVLRPAPRVDERLHLRIDVGARGHDALGPACRAARVDHHGAAGGRNRQAGRRSRCKKVSRRDEPGPDRYRDRRHAFGRRLVGDDDRRPRVANHVVELGRRVRQGERHGDAAGPPGADECRHVLAAGRNQKRDAALGQVRRAVEEGRRRP